MTALRELRAELSEIERAGLYKRERPLATPQEARIALGRSRPVLNLCANDYLGLADHPEVVAAAREGLERWGFGLASVRFICGTQEIHLELERRISAFLGTEDTILYGSCFDANGGLFDVLLDERDAVVSDALNHASIIDGIRLCKARRLRYRNGDLKGLEARLREASGARRILIATDGVFSMDGYLARLDAICDLARRHGALVMVDDSHAVGVVGAGGRGTPEHFGVADRVDVVTGTLGKALGGATGGYTSGRREIVDLLRQRSRPYLFSNSLAPPVVAASLKVLDLIEDGEPRRARLHRNTGRFRAAMAAAGFDLLPGEHPIVPVMFGDAPAAVATADRLLDLGLYVTAFSYPVVPHDEARIRTQLSAAHSDEDIDFAVECFTRAGGPRR
ncbi:MAG: glycine C-acetyltransferase [Actinobacteria bacterium]|nr:glycine C-acetyltransferase [Actinomycetota bacterium]